MPILERVIFSTSRPQEVVSFAQDEVEKYRSGDLTRISTIEQLQARFGYTEPSTVYSYLRKAGLIQERRALRRESRLKELIVPSTDWAWMMGILVGGGCVPKDGTIAISNPEERLGVVIRSRAERLFDIGAHIQPPSKSTKSPTLVFNSVRHAEALGDLSRDECVDTISSRHKWILGEDRYSWSFLEGIFETRGHFIRNGQKKFDDIIVGTTYKSFANFLAELMVRVGVRNPTMMRGRYAKEGIRGVQITALEDLKHFAEHVHSAIPRFEESLSFFRDLNIEQFRAAYKASKTHRQFRIISSEDIVDEWIRVTQLIGHTPTSSDLQQLRAKDETAYCWKTYVRRFGDGKSFKSIAAILNKMAGLNSVTE